MALRELVYELVHPLLGAVARNHWLINRLFDVRVPRGIVVHFDPTTLLLCHALRQTVTADDKIALEVGVGQGALLAIGLLKSTSIKVQGVDCSAARVLSSQQVEAHNQLEPQFYTSDLFDSVPSDQQFDLIFFNPPYVPTCEGRKLKLTRRMCADSDRVWDGGDDGAEVLRSFLEQAHRFLTPRGRILFGVQPIFLPVRHIETIVADADWKIKQQVQRCCIGSVVYVLERSESKAD